MHQKMETDSLVDKDMNVRVIDYGLAKKDNAVIKEIGTELWGVDGENNRIKEMITPILSDDSKIGLHIYFSQLSNQVSKNRYGHNHLNRCVNTTFYILF